MLGILFFVELDFPAAGDCFCSETEEADCAKDAEAIRQKTRTKKLIIERNLFKVLSILMFERMATL